MPQDHGWFGAYWHPLWFQLQRSACAQPLPIVVKELLLVIVVVAIWGPVWVQTRVLCHCDNQSFVHNDYSVTHESTPPHDALATVPFLPRGAVSAQSLVHAHTWVLNDLADDLSCDRLSSFLHTVPTAYQHPCLSS